MSELYAIPFDDFIGTASCELQFLDYCQQTGVDPLNHTDEQWNDFSWNWLLFVTVHPERQSGFVTDPVYLKRMAALMTERAKAAMETLPEMERAKWRRQLKGNPGDVLVDNLARFTLADLEA
jgi:hypothetical protein